MTENILTEKPAPVYAPIWRRFVAMMIDGIIIIIPSLVLGFLIPYIGGILLSLLYEPFFESSDAQATPGKRIMGIIVARVSDSESRITVQSAYVRYFIAGISGLLFALGHIMAFFTDKNQAFHDKLAESVVVMGKKDIDLLDAWIGNIKRFFSKA